MQLRNDGGLLEDEKVGGDVLCVRDENGTDSFGSGVESVMEWPH